LVNNIRTPQFAGRVYSADPTLLTQDIAEILALEPLAQVPDPKKLRVLKVPHIDYYRGHRSYGRGYQLLKDAAFDVIFLMGTSHQLGSSLFIGTESHYSTPLGTQQSDATIMRELAARYGERLFHEQTLHTHEHSLELQLPFITHLLPNTRLVPILVGSFHHFYHLDRHTVEPYTSFLTAMTALLEALDQQQLRYGFIAGVDMAHVGGYFGDPGRLTDERAVHIQNLDQAYLEHIAARDPDKLFAHCVVDNDAQRMCGHATMVTICDILARRGETLTPYLAAYEQCFTADNDCLVSIASLGLYTR